MKYNQYYMLEVNSIKRKLFTYSLRNLLSSIFLGYLISTIPWSEYRGQAFTDIERYIYTIESGELTQLSNSFGLTAITEAYKNEQLWQKSMIFLIEQSSDPKLPLYIISLSSAIIFSYFTVIHLGFIASIPILFNPLLIDLLCSQVRSAYATSLILISLLSNSKFLKTLLLLASCFIHSASLIFIFIIYLSKIVAGLDTKIREQTKKYFFFLAGFFLSLFIAFGSSVILGSIGDRRASYVSGSSSVMYASYWMIVGLILIFSKNNLPINKFYYIGISIITSTLFFFLSIFNVYGSRFLSIALPIFMISAFELRGKTGNTVKGAYFLYLAIQFYYWI